MVPGDGLFRPGCVVGLLLEPPRYGNASVGDATAPSATGMIAGRSRERASLTRLADGALRHVRSDDVM